MIEQGFHDSMKAAFQQLKNDTEYQAEYGQFVDAMSYADDDDHIDFKVALDNFEALIECFDQ